ncbi:hypothetical protein OG948_48195 (plasmid) [Embleya sp. NBC_00888]|uniref:hypothetical protein n=1 Tax=Embleya sp. NBC_00888 TaxID=2975960 RepID=UPI002F90FBAA|nr:hypothetical protein OG948_48195 [Embleya sp. NBC_00888]
MVDDGTQVLEAPRFVESAPSLADPAPSPADPAAAAAPAVPAPLTAPEGDAVDPVGETARLVARMRHGHGVLARVATTLNNHGVRRLTYVSTEFGAATVEVTVLARDAARVEARLRRMVEVVEVGRVPAT